MEEDLILLDAPPCFRDVKLPAFWSDKPASWFSLVEARFRTYGITGEQAKFDQLVGSLSKESIGRVLDLVENPPLFTPYTILKARSRGPPALRLPEWGQLTQGGVSWGQVTFRASCRHAGSLPARTRDQHFLHTPVPVPPSR